VPVVAWFGKYEPAARRHAMSAAAPTHTPALGLSVANLGLGHSAAHLGLGQRAPLGAMPPAVQAPSVGLAGRLPMQAAVAAAWRLATVALELVLALAGPTATAVRVLARLLATAAPGPARGRAGLAATAVRVLARVGLAATAAPELARAASSPALARRGLAQVFARRGLAQVLAMQEPTVAHPVPAIGQMTGRTQRRHRH